jgi:hypothetical protein
MTIITAQPARAYIVKDGERFEIVEILDVRQVCDTDPSDVKTVADVMLKGAILAVSVSADEIITEVAETTRRVCTKNNASESHALMYKHDPIEEIKHELACNRLDRAMGPEPIKQGFYDLVDPRTPEEIALDEWQLDAHETRFSEMYDFTPFPRDMPGVDFDIIDEIPF